jgi:hypothetical protein
MYFAICSLIREERWKNSRAEELLDSVSSDDVYRSYGFSVLDVGEFNVNWLRRQLALHKAKSEYDSFARDWESPFNEQWFSLG